MKQTSIYLAKSSEIGLKKAKGTFQKRADKVAA